MNNLWLKLAEARKVAADVQIRYCGQSAYDYLDLISEMILYMMEHPKFCSNMMLRIHWDDADCVSWVQIYFEDLEGFEDLDEHLSSVPR